MCEKERDDSKDGEFYWDHLKHEDTLFNSRNGFFFVGESMLVAAVVQLSSKNAPEAIPPVLFCFVGLLVSGAWLYASIKHVWTTRHDLRVELHTTHKAWDALDAKRKKWPSVHKCVGIGLPTVFAILWLLLWALLASDAQSVRLMSRALNCIGFVFDLLGVAFLWLFGLPAHPPATPPSGLVTRWLPRLGVVCLTLGFTLQLLSAILG